MKIEIKDAAGKLKEYSADQLKVFTSEYTYLRIYLSDNKEVVVIKCGDETDQIQIIPKTTNQIIIK